MVTRRQFGVLVAAGVALTLPKVVNAVTVTEMDVTIKTPDGTCDACTGGDDIEVVTTGFCAATAARKLVEERRERDSQGVEAGLSTRLTECSGGPSGPPM
jgi:hypothetical protein